MKPKFSNVLTKRLKKRQRLPKKKKLQKHEKAKSDIFAAIKRPNCQTDIKNLQKAIVSLEKDFSDSDNARKLEQHLLTRCRDRSKKLEQSAPDKSNDPDKQQKTVMDNQPEFIKKVVKTGNSDRRESGTGQTRAEERQKPKLKRRQKQKLKPKPKQNSMQKQRRRS